MHIRPFSCVRPQLDQADEALGYLTCARMTGHEAPLDDRLASELFMTDAARAMYVCELRDVASRTVTGVIGCLSMEDVEAGVVTCAERLNPLAEGSAYGDMQQFLDAVESVAGEKHKLGAQDETVTLVHPMSFALDVILTAAKTATPLWKISQAGGNELTVWRVSRPDAIEALEATFEGIDSAMVIDERSHLVAEGYERLCALVRDGAHSIATGIEPAASFPVLLVPSNQLSNGDVPTLPRGLYARKIR